MSSVPDGWGVIPNGANAPIYYPPPARYSWRFAQGGVTLRTPWYPVTVSNQMVRRPPSPAGWTRFFDLFVEPGCVVTSSEVSFS